MRSARHVLSGGYEVIARFRRPPYAGSLSFDDFGGLPDIVHRAQELIELPLEKHEALARIGARPITGALGSVERPELVWSGPEVPGVHARDTRRVFEELVDGAERSIWVSAYAFYDGPRAFKRIAARMEAAPDVQVTLLLNVQRRANDSSAPSELVSRFAGRFWGRDWPGGRRPEVFYDPRSLEPAGAEGVLHAKALVVDDTAAFVTSANLTEAAFDRNLELGVLSRDRTLAASLARHFRILVDRGLLLALPSG